MRILIAALNEMTTTGSAAPVSVPLGGVLRPSSQRTVVWPKKRKRAKAKDKR